MYLKTFDYNWNVNYNFCGLSSKKSTTATVSHLGLRGPRPCKICSNGLWFWFVLGVRGVQITHLFVPEEVRNGTSDAAILDCEYTLTPADLSANSGLVVKWFFNSGPAPVYQWIPGQRPQVCPISLALQTYIRGNMLFKYTRYSSLTKQICSCM